MDDCRYWIAINGPSCARTSVPMRHPTVSPTPEQLVGFPSELEARAAQRLCLEEPMPIVRRFFENLEPHVRSGVVKIIQPAHPEPPTTGPTFWMDTLDPHDPRVH
jgi:hypothetical protein